MPRDALDGGGQIAIALRDHGRQPVDLVWRFGRRLDLDPAADAVEDGFRIEWPGCRQHGLALSFRARFTRPATTAYCRLRRRSNQNGRVQPLSDASRSAICSTSSTMLRLSLASAIRVKARVSAKPSEVARKSET